MRNSTPLFRTSIFFDINAPLAPAGKRMRGAALLFAALACLATAAHAQRNGPQVPPVIVNPMNTPAMATSRAGVPDPAAVAAHVEMMRMANIERQRKMVEDANRLVLVANQLKASVDKTTKDVLSLDVLKQADEAERLARSVKDKMRAE
ncbi:MAG: hypothetical protein ACYCSN_03535 [Acidobacteriaceae bacterium]